jgi:excisionase family DNA binding protein
MQEHADESSFGQIPEAKVYTLREAAKILRVSERTLRQSLQSGQIRGYKIGGHWRISHAVIERILSADENVSGEPAPPDAPYGAYEY